MHHFFMFSFLSHQKSFITTSSRSALLGDENRKKLCSLTRPKSFRKQGGVQRSKKMSPSRNSRDPGAQKGGGNVIGRRGGRKVSERKGGERSQGPTSFASRGVRGKSRAGPPQPQSLGHSQDWGKQGQEKVCVHRVGEAPDWVRKSSVTTGRPPLLLSLSFWVHTMGLLIGHHP